MLSTLALRVAACDSISRVLVVAKINLPRSQSLAGLLKQYCRWLFPCHHSFAWNCLFRLLSSAKSIMRQVRITLVCWRRLTLCRAHTMLPRVPIFFGILVGTHKKSRPRGRKRKKRTPRHAFEPNGKKSVKSTDHTHVYIILTNFWMWRISI